MNELSKKGGQPSKPTRYACLWNNNFYQGIVSQRNPLRSNLQHIEEEYYGNQVSFLDGLNTEISSKLTPIRRPGSTPYQTGTSNTYPAINRFYSWELFNSTSTAIEVIADTASKIYSIPSAGTGLSSPPALFTKSAGAGSTYFQSVGNILYFSDGVDLKKVLGSPVGWQADTAYAANQYIIDSNGNLEVAIGPQTATITNIEVVRVTALLAQVTLFFSPATPLSNPVLNMYFTLSGLTTVPSLNGLTIGGITAIQSPVQVTINLPGSYSNVPYSAETGTATTGNGISGSTQPTWTFLDKHVTLDAGTQWVNVGSPVENWGIAPPANAPTVTQVPATTLYPVWDANTWYSPQFIIVVSSVAYQLTTAGVTGSSTPTFNPTLGATTTDGTAVWTSLGPTAWAANTVYALGDTISITYTYYVNTYTSIPNPPYFIITQTAYTATSTFQVITAGTSGVSQPNPWNNGVGTTTQDNTVVWRNVGTPQGWPGATQTLSLVTKVLDSNGNIQSVYNTGKSGSTAPTWMTATGSYTQDNTVYWLNSGPYAVASTEPWIYAYSFVNSVTDTVSTASPESQPITVLADNFISIQGQGSSDPQVNQIYIWRTVQGGSQLFYLTTILNPGGGMTWTYLDTTPDTGLNELIEAPIDEENNPPPVGLTALTYHLGLIWGAVNNTVYFSDGPYAPVGNGNEAWNPSNVFVFPSTVVFLFPTSSGLLVFTTSDIFIIQGTNTAASPLYSVPFLQYIGIVSYDAVSINGAIVHLYTSDNQVLTLDPASGVSETGFPIGDQFGPGYGTGTFTPSSAHVTWHIAQSQDKGLYVSDFQGTWWRMCPTPSPESGTTWSPKAQIVGGFSSVQSVETSPGTHNLLIGPLTSGPILERNYQVYSDNGSAYPAWAVLGSLVLAQPGQLAMVESLTTDSIAVGTPISLAVQLDEISSYTGLASVVINAAGTGYNTGDLVAISGGTGGIYKVMAARFGVVSSLAVVAPGENYPASQTGAATTAITGSGTGLTVNTTNGGLFETLSLYVPDPTETSPSITTYAQRFYVSQTQLPAVCRHLQILINWGTDTVKNELLSLSLFGAWDQEK